MKKPKSSFPLVLRGAGSQRAQEHFRVKLPDPAAASPPACAGSPCLFRILACADAALPPRPPLLGTFSLPLLTSHFSSPQDAGQASPLLETSLCMPLSHSPNRAGCVFQTANWPLPYAQPSLQDGPDPEVESVSLPWGTSDEALPVTPERSSEGQSFSLPLAIGTHEGVLATGRGCTRWHRQIVPVPSLHPDPQ